MKNQYKYFFLIWVFLGESCHVKASQSSCRRRSCPPYGNSRAETEKEYNYFVEQLIDENTQNAKSLQKQCNALQRKANQYKVDLARLEQSRKIQAEQLEIERKANQQLRRQAKDSFSNWLAGAQAEERLEKFECHIADRHFDRRCLRQTLLRWKKRYNQRKARL